MPATLITPGSNSYEILDSGRTYLLEDNALLNVTGDTAIFAADGVSDDIINIKGQITQSGMGVALEADGTDMTVRIFAGASVLGSEGVTLSGANAHFTNGGTLRGTDGPGLSFSGPNAEIVNNGKIFTSDASSAALEAFGTDSTITNTGKIQGGAYGINVTDARVTINLGTHSSVTGTEAAIFSENTEETDRINLTNRGDITGQNGGYGVELQDSNDTIVNLGSIHGRIYMGSGKDVFDNRGGTVDHAIEGGAGDDTLITDNAATKLKENGGSEGFDTVKSTVNYTLSANVERLILMGNADLNGKGNNGQSDLFGNAGDNKLFALKGVDTLDGGRGNDQLTGGANSDTFIFKTGNGHDTIMDFENGIDRIDVSNWDGIDNFSDVKHHLTASHGDLIITLGSDQLIIADTPKSELNAGDFLFPA